MFRPIKNFITYIQRNAGSSAIFGGATAVVEVTPVKKPEVVATTNAVIATPIEKNDCDMERNVREIIHSVECAATEVEADSVTPPFSTVRSYEATNDTANEEDDIEQQIKSSIMVRKPLKAVAVSTGCSTPFMRVLKASNGGGGGGGGSTWTAPPTHDYNQNHQRSIVIDNKLENFRNGPRAAPTISDEDFCSLGSGDTAALFYAEGEGEEEEAPEQAMMGLIPEIPAENFTFPDSEVIVLSDDTDNYDINSSMASDVPSEDPLAIDDFTQPSTRDLLVLHDSSTNDETSSGATDILWINIDDIKEKMAPDNMSTESPNVAVKASTSLNQSASEEHAEELRSDGSDSGLGSETTSALQTMISSAADTSCAEVDGTPTPTRRPSAQHVPELGQTTSSGDEKKNSAGEEGTAVAKTLKTSPEPLRSNLKRRLTTLDDVDASSLEAPPTSLAAIAHQKKQKRSIHFASVQIYYFQRQQGFGCVPSAGGCTLGMSTQHVASKTFSLAEHAAELRRAHRLQQVQVGGGVARGSSTDESEESEEEYLSEEGSGSDPDAETNGFLQPVSPKQRRALLKAAGVRKIDASEKLECRDIRNSREVCGCTCRDFCDPETCACSQAGIKCQVDRSMFPCGCSRDACGNTIGRIEFNPARVRTHYMHTIMRLDMANRQQQNPAPLPADGGAGVGGYANVASMGTVPATVAAAVVGQPAAVDDYYALQATSNYNNSSGYTSPAYTNEPASANYYQTQGVTHGQEMALPTPPLLPYQLDSLDASLFSGAAAATPSYGALMPAYCAVVHTPPNAAAAYHHHGINYAAAVGVNAGSPNPLPSHISPYSAYHPQAGAGYYGSTFTSSCAVPTLPPYGSATTTTASAAHYPDTSCVAAVHENIAPAVASSTDGRDSCASFISLSTPIASSSRLSQINDLLQHNRNTTAALVAVSQGGASGAVEATAGSASIISPLIAASIDTPPIENAHKSCLTFEELAAPPPLNPTPIVAVLENDGGVCVKTPPSDPPPSAVAALR